ncbi:MAG: tetratricopeptide repeat protein, partial [Candidatus Theseobacter exili]|nr:tetratricopeptide repeat protein [Candidatus Theseobacter exili]
MAKRLSQRNLEYIKQHYRNKSNRQLAEELHVDKKLVNKAFKDLNLRRSKAEEKRLKDLSASAPVIQSEEKGNEITTPIVSSVAGPNEIRRQHILFTLILIFVTLFCYANSFKNELAWDDEILVRNNVFLRSSKHIPEFFTKNTFRGGDRDSNFWRPTQLYTYFIDYSLWGPGKMFGYRDPKLKGKINPVGFHISNTLFHTFVVLLIYILFFLITNNTKLGLMAGLLYAICPLHTEAVTYVAGRADSLVTMFMLLSLVLYIRYTRDESNLAILSYFGAFLSYTLAFMSKEMAIMFPLLLILYDFCFFSTQKRPKILMGVPLEERKKVSRIVLGIISIILRYIPFLVLLGIYAMARSSFLDFRTGAIVEQNFARNIPVLLRLLTFTKTFFAYLMTLVLPLRFDIAHAPLLGKIFVNWPDVGLHMERGMPYARSLLQPDALISLVLFSAIFIYTIFQFKRDRLAFYGLAWFFLTLIPFSDIVPLNANMAEHWLYIPFIGLCFFIVYKLYNWMKMDSAHFSSDILKRLVFSPFIFIVIFYGAITMMRNLDWKDDFSIWANTAELSNSSHIHGNLGVAYGRRGNFQQAKQEFIKAIRIQFNYPEAHNNLGVLFLRENKLEDAKKEFQLAIKFNPTYANAHKNLGDTLERLGNIAEA